MYVVGELLFPSFELTLNALVVEAGLPTECLKIGPLKDPVRIHEKVGRSHHFNHTSTWLLISMAMQNRGWKLLAIAGNFLAGNFRP